MRQKYCEIDRRQQIHASLRASAVHRHLFLLKPQTDPLSFLQFCSILDHSSLSIVNPVIDRAPSSSQSLPSFSFAIQSQRSESQVCVYCSQLAENILILSFLVNRHCRRTPSVQSLPSSFSVAVKLQRSESQVCVYCSQLAENTNTLSFLVNRHCRRTSLA